MLSEVETTAPTPASHPDRTAVIAAVIEEIRPRLRRDGGDCQLVAVEGNRVLVKLSGACVLCRLSSTTLEGIQARVVERLGELVRLVPVAGATPGHRSEASGGRGLS
jgi:Fe-S cluster biogenesis protein NfuA